VGIIASPPNRLSRIKEDIQTSQQLHFFTIHTPKILSSPPNGADMLHCIDERASTARPDLQLTIQIVT